MLRNEDGMLTGYVYVDTSATDVVSYVRDADRLIRDTVRLPQGIRYRGRVSTRRSARRGGSSRRSFPSRSSSSLFFCSRQYAVASPRRSSCSWPCRSPRSARSGRSRLLGYHVSVAVWVGLIALMGVGCRDRRVHAALPRRCVRQGPNGTIASTVRSISSRRFSKGPRDAVRPKLMTAATMFFGLLPILWSDRSRLRRDEANRCADDRRHPDVVRTRSRSSTPRSTIPGNRGRFGAHSEAKRADDSLFSRRLERSMACLRLGHAHAWPPRTIRAGIPWMGELRGAGRRRSRAVRLAVRRRIPETRRPGSASINPMTALALALSGLSLWLLRDGDRDAREPRLGRAFAVAVAGIGALRLVGHLAGWNQGIDTWVHADKLELVSGGFGPDGPLDRAGEPVDRHVARPDRRQDPPGASPLRGDGARRHRPRSPPSPVPLRWCCPPPPSFSRSVSGCCCARPREGLVALLTSKTPRPSDAPRCGGPAGEDQLGFARDEMIGRNDLDYFPAKRRTCRRPATA